MKFHPLVLIVILLTGTLRAAEPDRAQPPTWQPPFEVDAETLDVLRKINSVGPYEVPELGLKQDATYAHTPSDVEPFGHVKPYQQHFLLQLEYTGPGRAKPEPEDVKTVKLGFIGPIMSTVSVATGGKSHEEALGIKMLQGARLAIEEANAAGGYLRRKIPFEFVVSNDNGLWGASGNEIVKMAYKDKVWAILGTIDGANSHIAIRVALKAEIVMMNTGDTDPTFIETNIPWVIRCIGDDRQQSYLLMDYLYRKLGLRRVGVIRASNRYGRFGVREILDGSRRLKRPVPLEMAYQVGSTDFSLQLDRLNQANVEAIVHWGDGVDGARILNQMRTLGMKHPFYACDRCVSDEFVEIAGQNAEGVICTYPWDPTRKDPNYQAFCEAFRKRFGEEPETYAAHAYDGMNLLIWGVQVAGLNRAKIRDVLAYRTKPWKGVTGNIVLSACLDDLGEVFLAKHHGGAWKFFSRKDLDIPRGYVPPRDRVPPPDSGVRSQGSGVRGQGSGVRSQGSGVRGQEAAASVTPPPCHLVTLSSRHPVTSSPPHPVIPSPSQSDEVRIGYFGPHDPDDPDGGDAWRAAQLAVEEANRQGGYRGLPFRLVPGWSKDPWGSGVARVVRMAYTDRVWAIVGGIDGPSTHLAEQVVAKARLPLISPASTDKSVNLANVPWMFSCLPGDHRSAPPVAEEISRRIGAGPFVFVSADDHDSHLFGVELQKCFTRRRMVPCFHYECRSSGKEADELAARIAESPAAAVVLAAGARQSARLVTALRASGFDGLVFGGPWMGRSGFLEEAGPAAEGVVFPVLDGPREAPSDFAETFRSRFGKAPDYVATQTYDATRLLIGAVGKAGLCREGIRDALRELSPWTGVAGTVCWDAAGGNTRDVRIGTIKNGLVEVL